MDNTGNTQSTVWERIHPKLVRAREIMGQACITALRVAAETYTAWQNMEVPCKRCRRAFPNRELRLMPERYPDWSHRFCPECCAFLQAEQERVSLETREDRVLQRQLDRAMEHDREATLTLALWLETLDLFDWHCAYCKTGPYELMEHRIPISQGGGTTVGNCVPACRPCNARKRDRHPDDIIAYGQAVARVGDDLSQRALPPPVTPS